MTRNHFRNAGRLVCAAIAALGSLYAVDGVVLIDMRAVNLGKITPADLPGLPVTISQPGSYRLSGNLSVPDVFTHGIEITASHVNLDLNGFSIAGPNVCTPSPTRCTLSGSGIGVVAAAATGPSPADVRVMNGTVRGMGFHGVRLMGEGTLVERVSAIGNGGPGIVVGAGRIFNSNASTNGGSGMIGLLLDANTSLYNASAGLFVRPGGAATGNVVTSNGFVGISAYTASLTRNTSSNNGNAGFDVTCPGVLSDNTSIGNTGGGYRFIGSCALLNNAQ